MVGEDAEVVFAGRNQKGKGLFFIITMLFFFWKSSKRAITIAMVDFGLNWILAVLGRFKIGVEVVLGAVRFEDVRDIVVNVFIDFQFLIYVVIPVYFATWISTKSNIQPIISINAWVILKVLNVGNLVISFIIAMCIVANLWFGCGHLSVDPNYAFFWGRTVLVVFAAIVFITFRFTFFLTNV